MPGLEATTCNSHSESLCLLCFSYMCSQMKHFIELKMNVLLWGETEHFYFRLIQSDIDIVSLFYFNKTKNQLLAQAQLKT